uniref:DUF218 domain-containing protein n=1 Tax=Strongyloides papillosus TaxID=174720 RepID=A0A0N5BZ81_STREA
MQKIAFEQAKEDMRNIVSYSITEMYTIIENKKLLPTFLPFLTCFLTYGIINQAALFIINYCTDERYVDLALIIHAVVLSIKTIISPTLLIIISYLPFTMKPLLLRFTRSLASTISLPKTTVLLIHNGQPRTLYYAKEFLSKQLVEHDKLPSFLAKITVDESLKFNKNLIKCMEEYSEDLEISNYLNTLSKNIENKLTHNAPFGKPYKVNYSFTFPISDKDHSIENSLMKMISKDGTQRLIVLPLHPIYGKDTNEYFKNKIDKFMKEHTELIDEENTNFKVVKNYPVSFDYSFINEWFNESFIVNYWSKRLEEICSNPEEVPDMIIFTTPYIDISGDREGFFKNYKNICGDIIEKLGYPSPWRSTFYHPWDSLLPMKMLDKSNLTVSIKKHQSKGKKSIVIVPIFDFIPTFNTTTILPQIASQKNVRFLEPVNSVEFLSTNFSDVIERELVN